MLCLILGPVYLVHLNASRFRQFAETPIIIKMEICTINFCPNSLTFPPSSRTRLIWKSKIRASIVSLAGSSDQPGTNTETVRLSDTSRSCNIRFKSLKACKLGISRYPDFEYNAEGGSGSAMGQKTLTGEILANFETATLYIPPLGTATTRFLGLPLPPFLKIEILPELFSGTIEQETGKVNLKFKAKFCFSVGSLYKAPPLKVETVLTSEESNGKFRFGRGERLNSEGVCRLVGVATVDPIDDAFMNTFLGLPTECLADLNAKIVISN